MAKRSQEIKDIATELNNLRQTARDDLKEMGTLTQILFNIKQKEKDINKVLNEQGGIKRSITNDLVRDTKTLVDEQENVNQAIRDGLPGLVSLADSADQFRKTFGALLSANPMLVLLAGAIALTKAFVGFQSAVTEVRKDLGLSFTNSVAVLGATKAIAVAAKGFGLEISDIQEAQAAIRNDLGASVMESVKLSLSFARTAAATGQSSEDLAKTLSIMESISGSSREVLLNQIRTNAAMIEAAGVAPALVMRDIASNAEFFATFARDGGQNLIEAGIAARKLGLSLNDVASITESLLDFESSIEASLQASVILGRQINTDRARKLALQGKEKELVDEIRRIVGGEAEFEAMLGPQRQVLARAVGLNVEQLARLVRNNTATSVAATAGGGEDPVVSVISTTANETNRLLGKVVRNTD